MTGFSRSFTIFILQAGLLVCLFPGASKDGSQFMKATMESCAERFRSQCSHWLQQQYVHVSIAKYCTDSSSYMPQFTSGALACRYLRSSLPTHISMFTMVMWTLWTALLRNGKKPFIQWCRTSFLVPGVCVCLHTEWYWHLAQQCDLRYHLRRCRGGRPWSWQSRRLKLVFVNVFNQIRCKWTFKSS